VFVPGKPYQRVKPEPIRVKHFSGALLLGRLLASPTNIETRLERHARDKYSSLLQKSVNYDRKKFYDTGPQLVRKGFLIYEKITMKKVL
jgi:hypothetical protein